MIVQEKKKASRNILLEQNTSDSFLSYSSLNFKNL